MVKFWSVCSEFERAVLVSSVFMLSIFVGVSIVTSDQLSISSEGLLIKQTAIANQVQLEQALQLFKLQQQEISEIKNKAIAIEQRTGVGGKLIKDLSEVEAKFPPEYAREIEQTIEQSELVLNGNYDQGN